MRTLVVAPHPDDEVLGCGGTLLRRKAEGGEIAWLIVTGITEAAGWPAQKVRARRDEIAAVREAFPFDRVLPLDLSSTRLDDLSFADVVGKFSDAFASFEPEEVLVPNRSDIHTDHRVAFDAVRACTKWFRHPSVRRVLAYETPSETEAGTVDANPFRPNVFVDIGPHLDRKLEILRIYASELGAFPFPRSEGAVRALASWRGASCGCTAAEAFELLLERS